MIPALSAQLSGDINSIATLVNPDQPPEPNHIPREIAKLKETISSNKAALSSKRAQLAQEAHKIHELHREITESSIRILEQSVHGSFARKTKSRVEYLMVMAEATNKKLQILYRQYLSQFNTPEMQTTLQARSDALEKELQLLRVKLREADADVDR